MPFEIKLAYYRKRDWNKFIRSVQDRESLHDTWEDWYTSIEKTRKEFQVYGIEVHEIYIDIDALSKYCSDNNLPNIGRTRSQYVSDLPVPKKKKR